MFFLLAFTFCDNIEIAVRSFDVLIVGDKIILSKDLKDCNNIKISYPGISIYELKKINLFTNKNIKGFILKEKTESFKKVFNKIRLDFEQKFYGLIIDAWIMIFIITIITFYFMLISKKPFGIFEI